MTSLWIAVLAAAWSVQSQSLPTVAERVLVTATVAPAAERALGRAATVITREDIERFAGGSIADALRLAPGVDVRARGERGVQADFVLRGASFGQTLVLVDGMRLNDAQSGHHNADFPVSPASIDRIEVVAGAASSAHGADAFGGTINIVRNDPRRGRERSRAAQTGGQCVGIAIGRLHVRSRSCDGRSAPVVRSRQRRPSVCGTCAQGVRRQWILRSVAVEGMDRSDVRDGIGGPRARRVVG
jgi:outer membrane cobalamin receptor